MRARILIGSAIAATVLVAGGSLAWAATQTVSLTPGNGVVVRCARGSLAGTLANNQWAGTCNATTTTGSTTSTTVASTTTTTQATTTTTAASTTTTGSSGSVAFVQDGDTGTFNGNTTSICSGCYNQVLPHNTGIGHTVVLVVQTLTDPARTTGTVSSISTNIGTFHFVNSYNDDADNEIWVCTNTTGAADTITVNTSTNAWDAFAVEFNAPAAGVIDGGGRVDNNLGYLSNQSLTVSPVAAGNVVLVQGDTLDAYTRGPSAPWTFYNSGYWDFDNGTSAAWQVTSSSSPVTATWQTAGGLSSIQGVVLEYA